MAWEGESLCLSSVPFSVRSTGRGCRCAGRNCCRDDGVCVSRLAREKLEERRQRRQCPRRGGREEGRVDDFLILVGAVSFARPRIVFLACILVHSSQLESQNSWRLFGSSCSSKFLASVTRHENGLTMLTRLLHKRNPICRLHHACLPSSDLFFREWTKKLEDISFAFQ